MLFGKQDARKWSVTENSSRYLLFCILINLKLNSNKLNIYNNRHICCKYLIHTMLIFYYSRDKLYYTVICGPNFGIVPWGCIKQDRALAIQVIRPVAFLWSASNNVKGRPIYMGSVWADQIWGCAAAQMIVHSISPNLAQYFLPQPICFCCDLPVWLIWSLCQVVFAKLGATRFQPIPAP